MDTTFDLSNTLKLRVYPSDRFATPNVSLILYLIYLCFVTDSYCLPYYNYYIDYVLQVILLRHDGETDEDSSRKLFISNKKTFFGLLQKVIYILHLWKYAEDDEDFEESTVALSSEKTLTLKRNNDDESAQSLVAVLNTFDATTREHKKGLAFVLYKDELEFIKDKSDEIRKAWGNNETAKISSSGSVITKKNLSLRLYKWISSENPEEYDELGSLSETECKARAGKVLQNKKINIIKSSFKIPSCEDIMKFTITMSLEAVKNDNVYKNMFHPSQSKKSKLFDPQAIELIIEDIMRKTRSVETACQNVIEKLKAMAMQQNNMFVFEISSDKDFNSVLKDVTKTYRETKTFLPVPVVLRQLIKDCVDSALPLESDDEDSEDTIIL